MPSAYASLDEHATWAASPLVPGNWRDLHLAEAVPLVLRLIARAGRPDLGALFIQCWPTRVRAMRLSFYPGWLLTEIQVALPDGARGLCNFLYGNPDVLLLDGTSNGIHSINEGGALKMESIEAVADYVRFFCSAIHASEGRFMVVERADEAFGRGRRSPTAPDEQADVLSRITPLTVQREQDGYRATAVVRYGVHVFRVSMRVEQTGVMEMQDDEPIGLLAMEQELFRSPFWVLPPDKPREHGTAPQARETEQKEPS